MTEAATLLAGGFLIGLGSGGTCFWSCAQVLGPYLVATAPLPGPTRWQTLPATLRLLGLYNLGRLTAYLAVGATLLLWDPSGAVLSDELRRAAQAGTALCLAAGLVLPLRSPACRPVGPVARGAFMLGLLQGLTPCPPFLAAAGLALSASIPLAGPFTFLALFAGTSVLTLPLGFVEPLRRSRGLGLLMRGVGLLICLHLALSAAFG